MNWLRRWLLRLGELFRKERRERELAAEMESHLQMHIEDNLRAGMSAEEARRQALIKLGGVEQTKEIYRHRRGLPLLETFLQDLRYGVRTLRKNPGFTMTAVLTLALGISASTSVFSLINAVLIRTLPYQQPERLVYLWSPNPRFQLPIEYLTPMNADFFDVQKQNRSFASLALFGVARFNLASEGRADAIGGARVTGDFFKTMGDLTSAGANSRPKGRSTGAGTGCCHQQSTMADSVRSRAGHSKQISSPRCAALSHYRSHASRFWFSSHDGRDGCS